MIGSRLAGHHKDACADHRADAEHDQVLGAEGPLQRGFALRAALDRLARIDEASGPIGLTLNTDFSIRYIP